MDPSYDGYYKQSNAGYSWITFMALWVISKENIGSTCTCTNMLDATTPGSSWLSWFFSHVREVHRKLMQLGVSWKGVPEKKQQVFTWCFYSPENPHKSWKITRFPEKNMLNLWVLAIVPHGYWESKAFGPTGWWFLRHRKLPISPGMGQQKHMR